MMDKITVALIQTVQAWEDKAANLHHFEPLIREASSADLIVLPEMFSTGFSMNSAQLAEPVSGETVTWLQDMSDAAGSTLTGSFIAEEMVNISIEGFGSRQVRRPSSTINVISFACPVSMSITRLVPHLKYSESTHAEYACKSATTSVFLPSRGIKRTATTCLSLSPTGLLHAERSGARCFKRVRLKTNVSWLVSTGSGKTATALNILATLYWLAPKVRCSSMPRTRTASSPRK